MVRVFVACLGSPAVILGYYYLALTSYKIGPGATQMDDASGAKFSRVEAVPAVYLGMIGVRSDCQRRGIGKLLMVDAIQRTAKIAEHAGTDALALDALDECTADYYQEQFGFQRFKAGEKGLRCFCRYGPSWRACPKIQIKCPLRGAFYCP